jgi:putative Mg2+ transporter-C (MgtC) family protein
VSDVFGDLFAFDWRTVLLHLAVLVLALLIALPVGWDRERATRAVGLRTFPLVAVGSAAYVMIARTALTPDADAQSRIIQGLITGIGFLGGGAIIKTSDRVRGTATAASIWSTAAIGAAVAYEHLEIALLLSAINFIALRLLRPFKKLVGGRGERAGSEPMGEAEADAVGTP